MADAGHRSTAREGPRLLVSRVRAAGIFLSAAGTLPLVLLDRLILPCVALQIVGAALLTHPWRGHRRVFGVLLANIGLVALYFWSLDETHTLSLHVTQTSVLVSLDGNTGTLKGTRLLGSVRLLASPYAWYHIQATGEPPQSDTTSRLGRLAEAMRLQGLQTGWDRLRLNGSTASPDSVAGFARNARGEWEGPPGTQIVFSTPDRPYTLTVNLMRPDGTQTILLGPRNYPTYGLQLRFDQPDMVWVPWRAGAPAAPAGGVSWSRQDFTATAQRDTRLLLANDLWALLMIAVAVGAYPALITVVPAGRERIRLPASALVVPGFGGLVATAMVASILLDRMPHVQDSVAYLFQARILASGAFSAPALPHSIQPFFQEEFVPFFHGRWFSQYPPGHPLALALGVLLDAPWLVGPVLASASLILVGFAGRRVYGPGTGLLAAVLGLSSPFWLFLGSSFMSHPTGLVLFSVTLLAVTSIESRPRLWAPILGLSAGWLFITRELTAVALLAPLAVYVVVCRRRALTAYLLALPAFAVPVVFLALYNWVLMGDPLRSTYAAVAGTPLVGFGQTVPGWGTFTPADGLWDTSLNLQMLEAHLFGWPWGIALAFIAVPFLTGSARVWDAVLLAVPLCLIGAYVLYPGSGLMYGPRYFYEALPAILLLSARGVVELVRLPLRVWPRLRADETVAAMPVAAVLAGLLLFNLRFYLPAQWPLYRDYNFSSNAELQAVASLHLHHALIFVRTDPSWYWWEYGNVFWTDDPWLQGDVIFARDLGARNRDLEAYLPGRTHYLMNYTSIQRIP